MALKIRMWEKEPAKPQPQCKSEKKQNQIACQIHIIYRIRLHLTYGCCRCCYSAIINTPRYKSRKKSWWQATTNEQQRMNNNKEKTRIAKIVDLIIMKQSANDNLWAKIKPQNTINSHPFAWFGGWYGSSRTTSERATEQSAFSKTNIIDRPLLCILWWWLVFDIDSKVVIMAEICPSYGQFFTLSRLLFLSLSLALDFLLTNV